MKVSIQILVCLGSLILGLLPVSARAQVSEAGGKNPIPHNQVISGNPFLLLGEWFNVEYERKLAPEATVGVAGSSVSFDEGETNYKSLNGFVRYYPSGALTGFHLGGRLGVHRGTTDDDEGHVYGLGVDIGYSWLLGSRRKFYVGLGIGATRFFGGDLDTDGRVILPSIRLVNVGFAF